MSRNTYSTQNLRKVYGEGPSAVHALRGVDLEIPEGEIVVLLGASGSGKSTLLNILGGLDRGTDGVVMFRDQRLDTMTDEELTRYRRNHVGFVFQLYNLMPSLTARENVELVTEISSNPMDPDESLAMVGLANRADHFPAQLSGGEQQRVAIARALANRPRIILADEPTAALDSQRAGIVMDLLRKVALEQEAAILAVTHDEKIFNRFDRIFQLRDGRLEDQNT